MTKKLIICLILVIFLLAACSDGQSSEAKLEDELYMKQKIYQEAYDQAVYDIKGELGEWAWCICVDQGELVDAIINNSITYGLTDEEAEDLRDMILSDIDGTTMKDIIDDIG